MQKRSAWLFGIAGFLGMTPASLADPGILAPQAAIQANYDHIYSAACRHDLSLSTRYFVADFRGEDAVNTVGNRTPPIDLAQLRQVATDYSSASQKITGRAVIQRLVLSGNQATATVLHHVILVGASDSKTGRHRRCVFDATTQDRWLLQPQGWVMQSGRGISLRSQYYNK